MEEIWKLIEGSNGYYVSNLGKVKSTDIQTWNELCQCYSTKKGQILKESESYGYKYVMVYFLNDNGSTKSRRVRVHKLVAEAFIPNPNGYKQINHIDGNKSNNAVSNLEWCDESHNMKHAYATGLIDKRKLTSINSSQATPYKITLANGDVLLFGTQKETFTYFGVSKTVFKSQKFNKSIKEQGIKIEKITKGEFFALQSSTTSSQEV